VPLMKEQKIIQKATDEPKNQLRKGEVGIRKIYSAIRREEKKEMATNEARVRLASQGLLQKKVSREIVPPPSLFHKDMRSITEMEVAPESVDLIFTDPPYKEHELPIYTLTHSISMVYLLFIGG
jgi:16S rRNA G966 N2-methylase RsmD